MDLVERNSKVELEKELAELDSSQSSVQTDNSKTTEKFNLESQPPKYFRKEELDEKKQELVCCVFIFCNNWK